MPLRPYVSLLLRTDNWIYYWDLCFDFANFNGSVSSFRGFIVYFSVAGCWITFCFITIVRWLPSLMAIRERKICGFIPGNSNLPQGKAKNAVYQWHFTRHIWAPQWSPVLVDPRDWVSVCAFAWSTVFTVARRSPWRKWYTNVRAKPASLRVKGGWHADVRTSAHRLRVVIGVGPWVSRLQWKFARVTVCYRPTFVFASVPASLP